MKHLFSNQINGTWKNPLPQQSRPKCSYFGKPISANDFIYYAASVELAYIPEDDNKDAKMIPINTMVLIPCLESEFDTLNHAFEYIDLGENAKQLESTLAKDIPLFVNRSRKV
jgi:hypothetical protein